MSDTLRFTLLPEGTSDRALVPLLGWLLRQHVRSDLEPVGQVVDTDRLPPGSISTDRDRLRAAVAVFPCEVLFVHRDADRERRDKRARDVRERLAAAEPLSDMAAIPVIPVRTTEAWLLVDESAIRAAAGYRTGSAQLSLPRLAKVESESDPKGKLLTVLRAASERRGRRLKSFDAYAARAQVAHFMDDPARLRQLTAFQQLEADVREACETNGWR